MSVFEQIVELLGAIFNLCLMILSIGLGCLLALVFMAAGRANPISILLGMFFGWMLGSWFYKKLKINTM